MVTSGLKVNMAPPHPGNFIRTEIIEELGLNVTKAAAILGVRRATLSALLNGNAALSPEMALRLEKAFGVGMDLLLRMQAWYDVSQMRARADEINVRRYAPPLTGLYFFPSHRRVNVAPTRRGPDADESQFSIARRTDVLSDQARAM